MAKIMGVSWCGILSFMDGFREVIIPLTTSRSDETALQKVLDLCEVDREAAVQLAIETVVELEGDAVETLAEIVETVSIVIADVVGAGPLPPPPEFTSVAQLPEAERFFLRLGAVRLRRLFRARRRRRGAGLVGAPRGRQRPSKSRLAHHGAPWRTRCPRSIPGSLLMGGVDR